MSENDLWRPFWGEGEVGSYHIGGDGQRAVCSDARTKQKTENSFVVVNGKSVARRNNTILLGKTFKKITRRRTRKKKKRLRHSQQSKSESNRGLTKGDGL